MFFLHYTVESSRFPSLCLLLFIVFFRWKIQCFIPFSWNHCTRFLNTEIIKLSPHSNPLFFVIFFWQNTILVYVKYLTRHINSFMLSEVVIPLLVGCCSGAFLVIFKRRRNKNNFKEKAIWLRRGIWRIKRIYFIYRVVFSLLVCLFIGVYLMIYMIG